MPIFPSENTFIKFSNVTTFGKANGVVDNSIVGLTLAIKSHIIG